MTITLNGSSGITTPDVTSDGLTVDSTTLIVDEANNRVGIGTSSPSTVLEVSGSGVPAVINSSNNQYVLKMSYANNTSSAYLGTFSNALILAPSSAVEAARIDSSGNFLVGTTSAISVSSLTTNGITFGSNVIQSSNNNASTLRLQRTGTDGGAQTFYKNTTLVGTISVTASSTSYGTSSDYRLKEDWQPMTGASERVKALKPVNFAWKVDGSRVDGFLAHEAQAVVPEAVTGAKDAVDADGNPEYQGIDQSKLVPLLTAALQEALAKIDDLTARVSALEATNV